MAQRVKRKPRKAAVLEESAARDPSLQYLFESLMVGTGTPTAHAEAVAEIAARSIHAVIAGQIAGCIVTALGPRVDTTKYADNVIARRSLEIARAVLDRA